MFNKEVYVARRKALLEKMKGQSGVIVFIGNVESPAQYKDNGYRWRQDSNWLYFFGIDSPCYAATIDLESGRETIYADDFDIDDIIWMGPVPSVRELAESAGVANTAPYAALAGALKGKKVHFLPSSRYYNAILLGSILGVDPMATFSQGKGGCPLASRPLVEAVVSLRLIKSEEEIALLDHACDLGYEMHTIGRDSISAGIIEQEIVGRMEGYAISRGWGVSFPIILTQHGEIFHCHSHEAQIAPGKLLVIDAGVENNDHYASDFTRTYPTSGQFTMKQREIYQTVCDCNNLAFSLTKPGVTYREVHIATVTLMLENLKALGLVNGDPAEMAEEGIGGLFMPHGLGHNIGLDCHDMEDLGENLVGYDAGQTRSSLLGLGSLRMARKLVPGHVVSDEPGIYFIPDLIRSWKAEGKGKGCINYSQLESYYDFGGIRLEDDVLVTADGARRLGSRRLPITIDEIEKEMQKD